MNPTRVHRNSTLVPAVALALLVPSWATAQEFLGFGGVEARVGVVAPVDATTGFGASLEGDLGYMGTPWLRVVGGLDLWSADVDRQVSGSLTGVGGTFGLRFDGYNQGRLIPYLGVNLLAQSVSAEVPDDLELEELLQGFYVGAAIRGGVAYALNEVEPRTWFTGDVRRTIMNNVDRWSVELGIRYTPRGRGTYAPPTRETETD
ncbi:MAG: hypothetical protein WEA09_07990 [Gemmatimonadota bacterium]